MFVKSYLFSGHVHDRRKQRQGARNQLRTAATYLGLSSVEDGGPQPSGRDRRVADPWRVTERRVMSQDHQSESVPYYSDGPDDET
jgi:hypothetical protein